MGIIGEQIKKFRIQKGYTQEKLSREIGVTTQAVSKWERGGTPDAEILPLIADALDVDVNSLFGREEQDLQLILTKKLSRMSSEDAFRYSFNLCWSIILGLTGDAAFTDDFVDTFVSHTGVKRERCPDYFAKLVRNDGMALARLSNDFRHFFLMDQPHEESISAYLEDMESIRKVFALLADKNLLKTICYMYTISNTPVTAPLIGSGTGLDDREVERCIKILCDNKLANQMKIATLDGEITAYTIGCESIVIPMICFADEIAKRTPYPVFGLYDRNKPLM